MFNSMYTLEGMKYRCSCLLQNIRDREVNIFTGIGFKINDNLSYILSINLFYIYHSKPGILCTLLVFCCCHILGHILLYTMHINRFDLVCSCYILQCILYIFLASCYRHIPFYRFRIGPGW